MTISLIVAADQKNCIGKQNKLPWHLKSDLQYFKKLTTNHCIIMGRNTFESIGKPLPNRVNIVLSTNKNYQQSGVVVRNTIEEAIAYCQQWQQQQVFIIGGAQIYAAAMPIVNKVFLTRVETEVQNGDAFFPAMDEKKWTLQNANRVEADEHNDFAHIFETYIPSTSEPIIYR